MAYYEQAYNTATPALDIMTNLQTWMPANGYTFVETYTSGTNISDVYKSPGTSNSFGTDFYIAFNRTSTTTTVVSPMVFEQWDAVNKKAIKYAPQTGGTTMTPASDGSVNDSGVLLSVTTAGASLYKSTYMFAPVSTATTLYININIDRIIWGSGTDYLYHGYAGLYDSFNNANPFPLVVATWGYQGNTSVYGTYTAYGAVTREPWISSSTANWGVHCFNYSSSYYLYPYFGSTPGVNPRTSLQASTALFFGSTKYTASYIAGAQMGLFKDLIWNPQGTLNLLGGDTLAITVGATTYNYVKPAMYTTYKVYGWIPKQ